MRKMDESEFHYRRLKDNYPDKSPFYDSYYEGDYYTQAYTTYYDKDKKELETKGHGYYG